MEAQLFTDGAARGNPGISGCACILFNLQSHVLDLQGKYLGIGTNNQAEYQGILMGLKLALKNGVTRLVCYLDSELVVNQLSGLYKVKNSNIANLKAQIQVYSQKFAKISYQHIPREKNYLADKLVNLLLDASLQSK